MQLVANLSTHGSNPHPSAHFAANSAAHTVVIGESNQGYFDVGVAFDASFDDTNYFATATLEHPAGNIHPVYVGYIVKSVSGVTVRCYCDTGGSFINQTVTVVVHACHA